MKSKFTFINIVIKKTSGGIVGKQIVASRNFDCSEC